MDKENNKGKEDGNEKDSYKLLIWLFITVCVLWALSWILLQSKIVDPAERGQFGDMFGTINSLFSGFAFAGIIYTIHIQRKELKLQRKELALQRQEVRRSTEELAGQKEMMYLQRFETTFFNLISAHKVISSSVSRGNNNSGSDFFENSYNGMIKEGRKIEDMVKSYLDNNIAKNIELCFENFIFILQFIKNENALDETYMKKYANIFTAQLPKSQINIMYYYLELKRMNGATDVQHNLGLMNFFGIRQ